jgi:hypothetical protein
LIPAEYKRADDNRTCESETTEYTPGETERLVANPVLIDAASQVSIRALAKQAGVSEDTVKALRR